MSGRLMRPLVFFGFVTIIGLLSLADRAPGHVRGLLRTGQMLGSRGEQRFGVDWLDRGDIPFAFDTIGHLVLWAIAGFLAWTAFGRRTSTSFLVVALITLSAGFEVGQQLLSSTRRPEVMDLIANAIGIGIGTVVAVSFWAVIGLFGRMARSLTR